MTNRKMRVHNQQVKDQKVVDFLSKFNLSETLVKGLGIKQEVKFFKESTLLNLTGVSYN